MNRAALIIGAGIGAAALWWFSRRPQNPAYLIGYEQDTSSTGLWDNLVHTISFALPSSNGCAKYEAAFRAAEDKYGLPRGLVARVAYQESHCREDVISGQVKSAAGAVGIMQLVPRWHPEVNPLDAYASIDYGARYIKSLYQRFGTWDKALAAYNWGPANVARNGWDNWPSETRNYVNDILGDVIV